jgi:hypothetical protein
VKRWVTVCSLYVYEDTLNIKKRLERKVSYANLSGMMSFDIWPKPKSKPKLKPKPKSKLIIPNPNTNSLSQTQTQTHYPKPKHKSKLIIPNPNPNPNSLSQTHQIQTVWVWCMPNNGRVCTICKRNWTFWYQMIALAEKLTDLKYEVPIASLDRDIRLLRYLHCM